MFLLLVKTIILRGVECCDLTLNFHHFIKVFKFSKTELTATITPTYLEFPFISTNTLNLLKLEIHWSKLERTTSFYQNHPHKKIFILKNIFDPINIS